MSRCRRGKKQGRARRGRTCLKSHSPPPQISALLPLPPTFPGAPPLPAAAAAVRSEIGVGARARLLYLSVGDPACRWERVGTKRRMAPGGRSVACCAAVLLAAALLLSAPTATGSALRLLFLLLLCLSVSMLSCLFREFSS